jgi:hypothetical protein
MNVFKKQKHRSSTFCSPSWPITFAAYKRNKKCAFASLNYAGRNS